MVSLTLATIRFRRQGGGMLPYMVYTGIRQWTGYGFQTLCPKQGNYIITCESVLNRARLS